MRAWVMITNRCISSPADDLAISHHHGTNWDFTASQGCLSLFQGNAHEGDIIHTHIALMQAGLIKPAALQSRQGVEYFSPATK